MKRTRNLFLLVGSKPNVSKVLAELKFKGMVSFPYGVEISDTFVNNVYKDNKSIVCAVEDYSGKEFLENAIVLSATDLVNAPNIAKAFEKIVNAENCDIGDHRSNSSGLNGTPTVADCAYCRYLAGFPADNERTVYKSDNFFVIPTVGQFIHGALLVIPFEHIMSIGELSHSLLDEFQVVLDDVEYLLKLTYHCPKVLVWENGSGNCGIGKAKDSIVHAHVHMYPSQYTSESIQDVSGFPFDTISLTELSQYQEHSYLLMRTPDYSKWKINNNPSLYIPRQYVRQLVAEEHGVPGEGWNWRTHPFSEKMYETVEQIKATIEENMNILPERIKRNTSVLFE